jgi:Uma2 family endonuclease
MTITPEAAQQAAAALPGDHRWEITPEGNLVLMSPANAIQSMIVMRLAAWFLQHGFNPRQVLTEVGIRTVGEGLRGPDLAVFDQIPELNGPWAATDELRLIVEVASPSTRRTDETDKVDEYARIGCPQYWTVEPLEDDDAMVVMRTLDSERRYATTGHVLLSKLVEQDDPVARLRQS